VIQLLRRTRWTQERIASRSGFRSVDALQRAFARQPGVTPKAWRDGARDDAREGGGVQGSPRASS